MALRTKNSKITVNEEILNVAVNIISITEDKLINILNSHINNIKKNNDWISSGSLFVSLICMAVTSEFHDFCEIKADVIKGFFYAGLGVSFVYFVKVVLHCLKHKDNVTKIVNDIKNQN